MPNTKGVNRVDFFQDLSPCLVNNGLLPMSFHGFLYESISKFPLIKTPVILDSVAQSHLTL